MPGSRSFPSPRSGRTSRRYSSSRRRASFHDGAGPRDARPPSSRADSRARRAVSSFSWLRRAFLENPLVGRQLATTLTAPRFGLVCGFVALVLLAADTIAIVVSGFAASTHVFLRGG